MKKMVKSSKRVMNNAFNTLVTFNVLKPNENHEIASFTDAFNEYRLGIGKDSFKMSLILNGINQINEVIFPDAQSDFAYKAAMMFLVGYCTENNTLNDLMKLSDKKQAAAISLLTSIVGEMVKIIEKEKTASYIA